MCIVSSVSRVDNSVCAFAASRGHRAATVPCVDRLATLAVRTAACTFVYGGGGGSTISHDTCPFSAAPGTAVSIFWSPELWRVAGDSRLHGEWLANQERVPSHTHSECYDPKVAQNLISIYYSGSSYAVLLSKECNLYACSLATCIWGIRAVLYWGKGRVSRIVWGFLTPNVWLCRNYHFYLPIVLFSEVHMQIVGSSYLKKKTLPLCSTLPVYPAQQKPLHIAICKHSCG